MDTNINFILQIMESEDTTERDRGRFAHLAESAILLGSASKPRPGISLLARNIVVPGGQRSLAPNYSEGLEKVATALGVLVKIEDNTRLSVRNGDGPRIDVTLYSTDEIVLAAERLLRHHLAAAERETRRIPVRKGATREHSLVARRYAVEHYFSQAVEQINRRVELIGLDRDERLQSLRAILEKNDAE